MSATLSDLRALLAGEVTSLYQNNPFRLLNIASNATVSQAQKRAQRLAVLRAQGEKAPDEIAVGEALQVLREPRRRLVAELFWFHTDGEDAPNSCNAQGLIKLKGGDWKSARELWRGYYQSDSGSESGRRALHNLAVLEHARVVTLEAGANPLIKRMSGNVPLDEALRESWREALQMWSSYLGDKTAWHFWRTRVIEMGDKRLDVAFVNELREILPETLLQINRDIARRYADAGFGKAAGAHCALMRNSKFDAQSALAQSRSVLDPIKTRVQNRCQDFENRLQANPARVTQLMEELRRSVGGDLMLLAQIDPKRELGAGNSRDAVAKAYHCAGWGWPKHDHRRFTTCLVWWGEALNLAVSPVLRADIADSMERFQKLKKIWNLAPPNCICCRQPPTEFAVFTNSGSGASKIAFLCEMHNDEAHEDMRQQAVDSKWYSLPHHPSF